MFEYLVNVMPQLISGTGITVKLFALTLIGSIPLGILLAFVLASRLRILKLIVQVYVWIGDKRKTFAASYCPAGIDWIPPRKISAK